jgi:hypothetical protein
MNQSNIRIKVDKILYFNHFPRKCMPNRIIDTLFVMKNAFLNLLTRPRPSGGICALPVAERFGIDPLLPSAT